MLRVRLVFLALIISAPSFAGRDDNLGDTPLKPVRTSAREQKPNDHHERTQTHDLWSSFMTTPSLFDSFWDNLDFCERRKVRLLYSAQFGDHQRKLESWLETLVEAPKIKINILKKNILSQYLHADEEKIIWRLLGNKSGTTYYGEDHYTILNHHFRRMNPELRSIQLYLLKEYEQLQGGYWRHSFRDVSDILRRFHKFGTSENQLSVGSFILRLLQVRPELELKYLFIHLWGVNVGELECLWRALTLAGPESFGNAGFPKNLTDIQLRLHKNARARALSNNLGALCDVTASQRIPLAKEIEIWGKTEEIRRASIGGVALYINNLSRVDSDLWPFMRPAFFRLRLGLETESGGGRVSERTILKWMSLFPGTQWTTEDFKEIYRRLNGLNGWRADEVRTLLKRIAPEDRRAALLAVDCKKFQTKRLESALQDLKKQVLIWEKEQILQQVREGEVSWSRGAATAFQKSFFLLRY